MAARPARPPLDRHPRPGRCATGPCPDREPAAADALREFLSQPRRQWPDDEQLAAGIAGLNFYWIGKASQRMFVLRRLEESYGHKELINWEDTKVQIEHVLPQSPTPEWLDGLEPDAEPGETATDLHERIVHRLGNLTVTGYNPDLSNKPFPAKRALLSKSHFSMSREVAEQESWGLPQIEARGLAITARAAGVWPGAVHEQGRCAPGPVAGGPPGLRGPSRGDLDGIRRSFGRVRDPPRAARQLDEKGRALAAQRLSPRELAALLGLDVPEDAAGAGGG
ncbi:MAG: HNH endonuclease family protein [Pseudonocardia sp.]|nr:HNH endonuclease family protein [Pseudonocardia sp.]